MLSATITGLPTARAVSKLPGPKPGKAPAVAVRVLPVVMAPSKRPRADADGLLSSPTAEPVGVLVQSAPAPTPLMDAQVAPATPAEFSAAMAIAPEASAPSSNPRAAPDVDLGVPTATASNCLITSAFHDAPAAPGNRFRHNSYLGLSR